MDVIWESQISRVCTRRDTDFTGFAQNSRDKFARDRDSKKKHGTGSGSQTFPRDQSGRVRYFQNSTVSLDDPVSRGIPRDVHNGTNPEESPDIVDHPRFLAFLSISNIPGQPANPVETRILAVKFDLNNYFRGNIRIYLSLIHI